MTIIKKFTGGGVAVVGCHGHIIIISDEMCLEQIRKYTEVHELASSKKYSQKLLKSREYYQEILLTLSE